MNRTESENAVCIVLIQSFFCIFLRKVKECHTRARVLRTKAKAPRTRVRVPRTRARDRLTRARVPRTRARAHQSLNPWTTRSVPRTLRVLTSTEIAVRLLPEFTCIGTYICVYVFHIESIVISLVLLN